MLKEHKANRLKDLSTFSIPVQQDYAASPGDVHYQAEGQRLQGIEVAKVIADVLGIEPGQCPSVDVITNRFKRYESSIQ